MERDAFLARVRAARATAVLPPHPAEDPGLLVPDLAPHDLAELFGERLEEAEGIVHRVTGSEAARRQVLEVAQSYDVTSFLAWDEDQLPVPGVADLLHTAGMTEIPGEVTSENRLTHQLGYEGLDLGITGAEAGFSESGTIVLRSGRGRPRMASLIPLVHVALLEVRNLHRSLAHWADRHAGGIPDATNVVFITGPSKTGDIEQNINVGVHGPRYVHILLLD